MFRIRDVQSCCILMPNLDIVARCYAFKFREISHQFLHVIVVSISLASYERVAFTFTPMSPGPNSCFELCKLLADVLDSQPCMSLKCYAALRCTALHVSIFYLRDEGYMYNKLSEL